MASGLLMRRVLISLGLITMALVLLMAPALPAAACDEDHVMPVSGRVVDEQGRPVAGVEVSFASGYAAVTDDKGLFEVMSFEGEQEMFISGPGIEDLMVTIVVHEVPLVMPDIVVTRTPPIDPLLLAGIVGAVIISAAIVLLYRRRGR